MPRRSSSLSVRSALAALTLSLSVTAAPVLADPPQRQLLWGDTHIHTYNSPDAFLMLNRSVGPDEAYRFAKGQTIIHPYTKATIRLRRPLDFLVVADHGEALGVIRKIFEGDARIVNTPLGQTMLEAAKTGQEAQAFADLIGETNQARKEGDPLNINPQTAMGGLQVGASVWREITAAADRHNDPGKFTAFIGWEWTSAPGGGNLHRVILLQEDASVADRFTPYTTLVSSRPEELWAWLDKTSQRLGAHFLAIPHNSNLSDGMMFDEVDSEGRPIDAQYARTRARWEPVVEATQTKGDSETHPALSPTDEFADFEFYGYLLTRDQRPITEGKEGDYVRSGLIRGLEIEQRTGVNPYKFGLIGSTDSHTGMSTADEDHFQGKFAYDSIPANKEGNALSGADGNDMGASGLAAVWAEENTRASIFEALQRKEVYATTGQRMTVRFFGGWDYEAADASSADLAATGYAKGIPMGGDLANAPEGKAPTFLIHAAKDPDYANLDRIQVVKGWVDADGEGRQKVFNVALADGRVETDGVVPPVGNTVNLQTAEWDNSIGDPQLSAVWTDPEFDPEQRAFYYVRVLAIPTPRHSLYDAVALQKPHPADHPATIQERAYTSPIWYTPAGAAPAEIPAETPAAPGDEATTDSSAVQPVPAG